MREAGNRTSRVSGDAPARPRSVSVAAGLAVLLLLSGCANEDATLFDAPLPMLDGAAMVSLSADVQPIFNASCATPGCHSGASPPQGMSLEEGKLFDPVSGIVGVASRQSPLLRVQPGSAMDSYLVHKLEGTQVSAGGSGVGMPFPGTNPLPDTTIRVIRDWIDQGAANN